MMDHAGLIAVVLLVIATIVALLRYYPPGNGMIGLGLLVIGQIMGLAWAPKDAMMGDVSRILYVHVPAAWLTLVGYSIAFVTALGVLFLPGRDSDGRASFPVGWDAALEAAIEVSVVLNALLLALGMLFARPTWGAYWTWDPRLTASAILWVTFVGVMLLRMVMGSVAQDRLRALVTAVITILGFVNVPIVYMSVRWWRSIHQVQSSPSTMSDAMVLVLRINAFAFLFVMVWMMWKRAQIGKARTLAALPPKLPDYVPPPVPTEAGGAS
jgi:heme exporter protein C